MRKAALNSATIVRGVPRVGFCRFLDAPNSCPTSEERSQTAPFQIQTLTLLYSKPEPPSGRWTVCQGQALLATSHPSSSIHAAPRKLVEVRSWWPRAIRLTVCSLTCSLTRPPEIDDNSFSSHSPLPPPPSLRCVQCHVDGV